jgi:hypothetical protein
LHGNDATDLDVYVEHAPSFASARHYILNRALEHLHRAGLRYRLLDRAGRGATGAIAFVHVNLTDVPPRHRPAPGAYALCLNGEATSISRVLYSRACLGRDSQYAGPVVVKSVLNYRGLPEVNYRLATSRAFRLEYRFLRRLGLDPRRKRCPRYALYKSVDAVPDSVWKDPRRIVERFLPGLLATPVVKYRYDFFLDVVLHTRGTYDSLLADPDTVRAVTLVDTVPNEVLRVRKDLRLDFGSMDYFVVDGEAVVVDANKTTACTEGWLRMFPAVERYLEEVGARLVEVVRSGSRRITTVTG